MATKDYSSQYRYKKKENIKLNFDTYTCYFLIKTLKRKNKNEVLERVRGLKDVTIVDVVKNDRLEAITSKSKIHDFSLFKVKFVTNKDPLERVEELKDEMLRSDVAKDKYRIVGIVYVKPQIATVKINK
jgi:hypothetical protein